MNADQATQTQSEEATPTESSAESTSTGAAAALAQPVGMGVLFGGVVAAVGVLGM